MTTVWQTPWMRGTCWWASFVGATIALSKVFEWSRLGTAESPLFAWAPFIAWVLVLGLSLMYLMYRSYESLKNEGKLGRTFGLFEWLYGRLNPPVSSLSKE